VPYRDTETIAAHLAEDAKGLERVAHDVLRLGVRLGLLMKELHAWHLASFLGILDAVEKQDRPTIDEVNRKEADHNGEPEFSKLVHLHGVTVEEMKQPLIAVFGKAKSPHETGNADEILSNSESNQDEKKPEKSPTPGERGTKKANDIPPSYPKIHRNSLKFP
jgi:hypothetical protein